MSSALQTIYVPVDAKRTLVGAWVVSPVGIAPDPRSHWVVRVGVMSGPGRVDWVGEYDGRGQRLTAGKAVRVTGGVDLERRLSATDTVVAEVTKNGAPRSLFGLTVQVLIGTQASPPAHYLTDYGTRQAVDGLAQHIAATGAGDQVVCVPLVEPEEDRLPRTLYGLSDAVTVSNTGADTTLLSCTIPGGTLARGRRIRIWLNGSYLNNTGVNQTLVVKMTFGGTTVVEDTLTSTTSGNKRPFYMDARIAAQGVPTTVSGFYFIGVGSAGGATTGYGDTASASMVNSELGNDTLSIDAKAAQVLTVSVTHGATSNSLTLVCLDASVEVV